MLKPKSRQFTNHQTYAISQSELSFTRGEEGWGEGIVREFGTDMYTLLYIKYINNKDLLYSTGNSTQYSVITYMGKESEKG